MEMLYFCLLFVKVKTNNVKNPREWGLLEPGRLVMSISRGYQRAVFSQSTAAQFEVVASPASGKKIRIRGLFLSAAAAQDIDLQSSTPIVDTSLGIINIAANTPIVLPLTGGGTGEVWLECADGEAFNITLGQAVQTDGVIFYDIVRTTGGVL